MNLFIARICLVLSAVSSFGIGSCYASDRKILTNHVGYEADAPKHAVILGKAADKFSGCALHDAATDQQVLAVEAKAVGPVQKWRDWYFWTLDFDTFTREGRY
jgi:hypothetical protein